MTYGSFRWPGGVAVGVADDVGDRVGLWDGTGRAGELDAVGTDSVGFAGLVVVADGGAAAPMGAALGVVASRPPTWLCRSGTVTSGLIPGRQSTRYRLLPNPAWNAAAAAG